MESVLIKEEWKWIPYFEGYYKISTFGRIMSYMNNKRMERKQPKLLKFCKQPNGYKRIELRKNCQKTYISIHRLVAITFIPNPDNLPQVNHINEVKTDNSVWNLEWCTAKYNTNYGSGIKRRLKTTDYISIGNKIKGIHLNRTDSSKSVYQYDLNFNLLNTYPSIRETVRQTGIDRVTISQCCNNKYCKNKNIYKNYIFSFKEIKEAN